ncbi:hypothetical protein EJ04DRAFT_566306 [Polyplosphaeria fusca]|uniref:Uncharacterized protein n=1 Tax=Polyplosphaeria fusca TaxID=682080 RepID=A0A9P4UZ36_9PLEO|nr:hypothetical protein EJ04DRAFT_566306 [Polyplosphaeria fusca]
MIDSRKSTTFANIRAELDVCDTRDVSHMVKALDNGYYKPLNNAARKIWESKYGSLSEETPSDKNDTNVGVRPPKEHGLAYGLARGVPIVLGIEELPWPRVPSLQTLGTNLIKELDNNEPNLVPSTGDPDDDKVAAAALLAKLGDPDFKGPHSLFSMECALLNDARVRPCSTSAWEGVLRETNYACDIMPAGAVRELDLEDVHQVSVLISGPRVWLLFPLSNHNLRVFMKYVSRKGKKNRISHAMMFDLLQDGLAFIQQPGETLIIPPFCLTASVSSKLSISVGNSVTLATGFVHRLQNMDLFMTQNALQDEKVRFVELAAFYGELMGDLSTILENKVSKYDARPLVRSITDIWSKAMPKICKMFTTLYPKPETAKGMQARELGRLLAGAMAEAAPNHRDDVPCWICGVAIKWNRRPVDHMIHRLGKHIVESHWEAAVSPAIMELKRKTAEDVGPDPNRRRSGRKRVKRTAIE